MAGIRIGGLASGMDIDSIVEKLMTAERLPYNKLVQKKTTMEWQRDSYRAVNTKLKAFDDYLRDNFLLSSSFNKKKVSVSNENVVSATATSAANGSLTIEKVDQLASASFGVGTIASKPALTDKTGITGDQNVTLSVLQEDGSMKDMKFSFKETDTIDAVMKKLNASNTGITAFYDQKTGQVSVGTKATGDNAAGAEIQVKSSSDAFGTTDSIFAKLGFGVTGDIATTGKNAKLTMNGAEIERNSNNFTVAGFNITLKDKTAAGAAPITLNAVTDVDSMIDKVKEFVEKYNDLISGMNDSLKEKKYRDFPPLSDEQRKDMSENEQKLWDEKAKSGLLRSDSILSGGLSGMRSAIYGRVAGIGDKVVDTLAEMGITTSNSYSDGGKLVIDEDKLRKALTENPAQVVSTLTNPGSKATANSEDTRGIVQRLRDSMKEFTRKIEIKAGKSTQTDQQYSIGKSLIDMNNRINNFQSRLKDVEARYWKQFSAMETAINKANSQSSYLSQFGQN